MFSFPIILFSFLLLFSRKENKRPNNFSVSFFFFILFLFPLLFLFFHTLHTINTNKEIISSMKKERQKKKRSFTNFFFRGASLKFLKNSNNTIFGTQKPLFLSLSLSLMKQKLEIKSRALEKIVPLALSFFILLFQRSLEAEESKGSEAFPLSNHFFFC